MTKLFHSFPHSSPFPFPTSLLRFQLVQVLLLHKLLPERNRKQPSPKKTQQSLGFCSEGPKSLVQLVLVRKGVLLQLALR